MGKYDMDVGDFFSPERRESRRKGAALMQAILEFGADRVFDMSKPLEDQEIDLNALPRKLED